MSTILSTKAPERGVYIMSAVFTDAAGEAVAPNTLTWTLSKMDGSIVNEREDVAVVDPTASESIVLQGADLAILANYDLIRAFTLKGTYTSDEGAGLPIAEEVLFEIEPAINLP